MRQMRNPFNHKYALISKLLNTLYPSRCPLCGSVPDVFSHSPICASCWSRIKRYTGPSCSICAMPFSSQYSKVCGQCLKKTPPFSKAIIFGLYEGALAEAINQMKFNRVKRLPKPLGGWLVSLDLPFADGIVPVPLDMKKLCERGFNQSLLMAMVISKMMRTPLLMD